MLSLDNLQEKIVTCLAVWWCSISSGSEIVHFILELISFIFARLVPEIVSQLDKYRETIVLHYEKIFI